MLEMKKCEENNARLFCCVSTLVPFKPLLCSCFLSEWILPENQDNCNGTPTHAEMKKLWFGYRYELLWTFKVIIFHTHFLSPRVEIYLDDS
jgi:hypothetical protein